MPERPRSRPRPDAHPGGRHPSGDTTWTAVGDRRVRAVEFRPSGTPRGLVCIVPGLSLTGYTTPTARALARRGLHCAVLDLPGLARSARVTEPHPLRAGEWASAWLRARHTDVPLVVLGHSTGAPAAIRAATTSSCPPSLLVLAGPVFTPAQRRLRTLALAAPAAYRRESVRELPAALRLAGHAGRVSAIIRAGMRLRPEDLLPAVTVPLVLTAGQADTMAPHDWLQHLRTRATAAPHTRVAVLPGSHNNLFTHPEELADLVVAGATNGA